MTSNAATPEKKSTAPWLQVLLIGLRLLLICAIVAGIISFVYALTLPKAQENLKEEKRKAIINIFGTSDLTYTELEDDAGFYLVRGSDGSLLGAAVESSAGGFGGDLTLMVGYRADLSLCGVGIVSHSETPGLGARVDDAGYLSQYNGKSGDLTLKKDGGNDIDAISGATISSRAVLKAVNLATERVRGHADLLTGGETK